MTNRIAPKFFLWMAVFLLAACIKTEIIPEVLEPELSVSPKAVSLLPGGTATLNAVFTDNMGQSRPELIFWHSTATTVTEVSSVGVVAAKAPGQAWIIASAGDLADSTLVTVAPDNNAVARVEITGAPATLNTGVSLPLQAMAFNMNNQALGSQTFTWTSSNNTVLSVDANGVVTGQGAGNATIVAAAAGVQSLPVEIQVLPAGGLTRSGQFSGNSGYTVTGTATLQQSGDELTLTLGNNFVSGNGPMLGVYLAKTASGGLNSQNSLKLDNLKSNTGMQSYSVPTGVGLEDYDYVVIYCIPFNVRFGTAKLL